MTSHTDRPCTNRTVLRILAALFFALVVSACSASTQIEPSVTAGANSQDTTSAPDTPIDDAAGSDNASENTFDLSALSTSPISSAAFAFSGESAPAIYPEPIVDACAAIDVATVNAIVTEYASHWDSDFSMSQVGSACRFQQDTIIIDLVVHRSDTLTEQFILDIAPSNADNVGFHPSLIDPSTKVFTEDSFNIETPYAWLAVRGDWAVMARNANGTGLMIGTPEDEDGFSALAIAAADNAQSLTPGLIENAEPAGNPCDIFTAEELSAAFGNTPLVESALDGWPECEWVNEENNITVRVGLVAPDVATPQAAELAPNVWDGFNAGQVLVARGDTRFLLTVRTNPWDYDQQPIRFAIAEQILSRSN